MILVSFDCDSRAVRRYDTASDLGLTHAGQLAGTGDHEETIRGFISSPPSFLEVSTETIVETRGGPCAA